MKKIAKTLMGLSIICILFSGCEAEKEMTKQEKLIVKPFAFKESAAKSSSGLSRAINQVRSMNSKHTNSNNSKLVFDEKSGMYFDDQKGLYIEKDGLKSYTFPVLKTTSDAKLKNICFNEKQNGSYDVYLVKYDLTKAESLTLTDQQKEAREKQFIPLIKDGVPLEELKMQCVDIYLSTSTEYVVPIDNGELTGNFGTTTVTHTTSVLIGSSCSMQGLSGGNQSGGNTTIASGGSGTGSGNNNPSQDGDIITGLNTRDIEGGLGNEELFFYNYNAFTSGLNEEEKAAFNNHPELMDYFIANGWSTENQGFVRTLIDKFQGSDYTEEQKETLSQLVSVCAEHHSTFDFDNSNSGETMSVGDIESQMNEAAAAPNNVFEIEDLPGDQNGFTGRCKVSLGVLSLRVAMNFSIDAHGKYTLKKENIESELSGIVFISEWTQLNSQCNVNNNSNGNIRVDLYGKIHQHYITPLGPINITRFIHIIIIVDNENGSIISTEKYED